MAITADRRSGTQPGPYRAETTADDLGLILRGIDPAEVRRQPRYRKTGHHDDLKLARAAAAILG